jgi:anti-anti-sigma factor
MSPRHSADQTREQRSQRNFYCTFRGTAAILTIRRDVDVYNEPLFTADLYKIRDAPLIVIDLTHCRYMDSSALHALVRARKAFDKPFRIVLDPTSQLQRLFEATQLHRTFPIFASVRAALRGEPPKAAM